MVDVGGETRLAAKATLSSPDVAERGSAICRLPPGAVSTRPSPSHASFLLFSPLRGNTPVGLAVSESLQSDDQ